MMILPAILATIAVIVAIMLLATDKNKKVESRFLGFTSKMKMGTDSSQRLFSTLKGFLLILCLVVIFATLVFYFG